MITIMAKWIIILFGSFIILVAFFMLFKPKSVRATLRKAGSTNFINYAEITVRIIPAAAMILYADFSKVPLAFKAFGFFMLIAISITTVFVTSHLIRQGIYINREAIGTLKLLVAPSRFIFLPYLLNGLFMTLISGLLSLALTFFTVRYAFNMFLSTISFIQLSTFNEHIMLLGIFTILLSILLGVLGSLIGIKSTSPKIK